MNFQDKVPPQDREAEQGVLGAMLLDDNSIPEAQRLLPDAYFYSDAHRKIFLAILESHRIHGKADLITVSDVLKERGQIEQVGGTAYLASLVDNVSSALVLPNYAAILKRKALLRQLIAGGIDLVNLAYDGRLPLEDIFGQGQALIADLMKQSVDDHRGQRLKMSLQHALDYFAGCRELPWSSLNEALGGLFGGELIVVGGLPGVGKSTLAHAILRHIAIEEKQPVAYFGPEMASQRIYIRQMAAMCRLPENDIKRSRIKDVESIRALNAASEKWNAADIYDEVIGERISALSLMARVRRFTDLAKRPMGLVVVENLQQVTWPGKKPGKETADAVLSALRAFGIEMKIPIYLSSQLNEPEGEAKDRRPTMDDLRGTGNTQELADKVLLLHRPGYHPKDKVLKKSEPGEVIIAKGGPSMIVPMTFIGSCFDWEERQEP